MSKKTLLKLLILAIGMSTQLLADEVINAAFKSPNVLYNWGSTPLLGTPGDNWNNLLVPNWGSGSLVTNPYWNNLADSTGTQTGVNFSITGTVIGVDATPFISNPDPLRSAFIAWNSNESVPGGAGPGESIDISWTLTGLDPNAMFNMCVYGAVADFDRSFNMSIEGNTKSVSTTTTPQTGCVLFQNITSDANGTISGIGYGVGDPSSATNEANWSGFQLTQVPEPSSMLMLGTGLIGVLGAVKQKLF